MINLKILIIILFLLNSCAEKYRLGEEGQYVVKIEKVGFDAKVENLGYYLVQADDNQIDMMIKSDKEYSVNSIISEIVKNHKAIPILDYPIKFWKQSCTQKRMVSSQHLNKLSKKDSVELSKVYNILTNPSKYSMSELRTTESTKYKLFIGFAEIKNKDICLIHWTHRVSDTTAILGNKFSL